MGRKTTCARQTDHHFKGPRESRLARRGQGRREKVCNPNRWANFSKRAGEPFERASENNNQIGDRARARARTHAGKRKNHKIIFPFWRMAAGRAIASNIVNVFRRGGTKTKPNCCDGKQQVVNVAASQLQQQHNHFDGHGKRSHNCAVALLSRPIPLEVVAPSVGRKPASGLFSGFNYMTANKTTRDEDDERLTRGGKRSLASDREHHCPATLIARVRLVVILARHPIAGAGLNSQVILFLF